MPIYPFERPVTPKLFDSPFLPTRTGKTPLVKGPGGLVDHVEKPDGEKKEGSGSGGTSRKRPRRTGTAGNAGTGAEPATPGLNKPTSGGNAAAASSSNYQQYQPSHLSQQVQPYTVQRSNVMDRSMITVAGGQAALGNNVHIEKLPSETSEWFIVFCG